MVLWILQSESEEKSSRGLSVANLLPCGTATPAMPERPHSTPNELRRYPSFTALQITTKFHGRIA